MQPKVTTPSSTLTSHFSIKPFKVTENLKFKKIKLDTYLINSKKVSLAMLQYYLEALERNEVDEDALFEKAFI